MCTDRQRRGLRGPVQSVREETAEYSWEDSGLAEKPWLVETETFDEQGCWLETTFDNTQHPEYSSKQVLSYDITGKLIKESFYMNGMLRGQSIYIYDSDGRLSEIPSCNAEGLHTGKRAFNYHPNGRKAEELFFDYQEHEPNTGYSYDVDANPEYDHSFNSHGARLIKTLYDLQGNPKELQFLSENGGLLSKVLFTTDAAGRIIKHAQYPGDRFTFNIPEGREIPPEIFKLFGSDAPLSQSELVYDEEGRKIEERMYFGDSLITKRIFTHGANGELVEAMYEGNGTLQSKTRIEHEYDINGNWTKKRVWSWNKKKGDFEPSLIYRRTITYHG